MHTNRFNQDCYAFLAERDVPFTKPEIKLVVTKVYRLLYVLREWVQADVRDADRRALAQGRPPGQPLIESAVKRVLARGLVDCQPASVAAALRRLQPFIARLVAAGDHAHALPPRPLAPASRWSILQVFYVASRSRARSMWTSSF